jgi:hypothetical protein
MFPNVSVSRNFTPLGLKIQEPDDAAIAVNIPSKLIQDNSLKGHDIRVALQKGVIALGGSVPSFAGKLVVEPRGIGRHGRGKEGLWKQVEGDSNDRSRRHIITGWPTGDRPRYS